VANVLTGLDAADPMLLLICSEKDLRSGRRSDEVLAQQFESAPANLNRAFSAWLRGKLEFLWPCPRFATANPSCGGLVWN